MHLVFSGLGFASLLAVCIPIAEGGHSELSAQGQTRSRRDSVRAVLQLEDASAFWLADNSARLAVQEFGSLAGEVAEEYLRRPDLPLQRVVLLSSLAVAGYEQSGFPLDALLDMARNSIPRIEDPTISFNVRLYALHALSGRANTALLPFWRAIARESNWWMRQHAAPGLACAGGTATIPELDVMLATEADSVVRHVVSLALERLRRDGDTARICGGAGLTRSEATAPVLQPDTALRARANVLFGLDFRR